MLGSGAIDPYLAGNLTGYTVGLVISVLLLALTVRAAKLPGTPVWNIALALCALLWNAGGLANLIHNPARIPITPGPASIAMAIQFTGAAVWPIPMLAIWRRLAVERWQCIGWRFLQALAFAGAAVIVTGVWTAALGHPVLSLERAKEFAAYNATFLLISALAGLLRGRSVSPVLCFSSLVVLAGLLLTTVSVIVQANLTPTDLVRCALGVTGQQSVLLVIIGTFFLFARFRFADLFIRYSLRILLASIAAAMLILLINAPFVQQVAARAAFPRAWRFFLSTLAATALLVAFSRFDRSLGKLVNRWIFRAPDYQEAARELGDRLRRLYTESEVAAAVESAVRKTLALDAARLIPLDRLPASLWPAEVHQGAVAEFCPFNPVAALLSHDEIELLVPVRAEGRVISVLAISPGPARRGLVSQEVNYLRSVAEQYGLRLDLLRLERQMADRQNREALLLQQVTEAELRALRAQVNPHFLFNSLNTIANLIVTDPPRAETMTLRLAKVFRHVLAHTSRPLVSIGEEMEFLRAYLQIEEARFGSRLQVEIDVAPEVALMPVPSLILQPLVENALKHGLAPKTGPGRLWISARAEGDRIRLAVEDDGVGPGSNGAGKTNGRNGVGLMNITQRLATLYQDRARIAMERRAPEGTRVTLLVPRDAGAIS